MSSGGRQTGKDAKIIVRGFGSINASNDPLYVLDGIPYDGDINSINPSDIESMSVLKDASAAALYGARGANGVVMITTKKGKEGTPKINFKASWGVSSRAFPNYETLNSREYLETVYDGVKQVTLRSTNTSTGEKYTESEAAQYALNNYMSLLGGEQYNPFNMASTDLIDPATGKINSSASQLYSDDWMDEAMNENPLRQEYQFSVAGGANGSTYNFSLGYLNEEGLAKISGFERYSGRINVDSQMKRWLKGGLSSNFAFTELNSMQEEGSGYYNVWYSSQMIGPIYPVYQKDENGNNILDADGNKQYDYGAGRPSFTNMNWIAALEDDRRERKTYSFSGRTYFTISDKENDNLGFFKDFSVTANFGADYKNQNYLRYYNPFEGNASDIGGSG